MAKIKDFSGLTPLPLGLFSDTSSSTPPQESDYTSPTFPLHSCRVDRLGEDEVNKEQARVIKHGKPRDTFPLEPPENAAEA